MTSNTDKQPTPLEQLGIDMHSDDFAALRYTALGEDAFMALRFALTQTENELVYLEGELARYADRTVRDMAELASTLADRSRTVNSLGVDQGTGARMDNMVGKLYATRQQLGMLAQVAKPLMALVDDAARAKLAEAKAAQQARAEEARAKAAARPPQCQERVYGSGGFISHQCSRTSKVQVDGKHYCKQHGKKALERAIWAAQREGANAHASNLPGKLQAAADLKVALEAQLAAL